jgi:hypothetical protein
MCKAADLFIDSRTYKYDTRTTRYRGSSRYEYTWTVPGTPLFARRRHKTHFSQYSRAYAFDATGIGPLVCPATSKHSPTIKQLLERETCGVGKCPRELCSGMCKAADLFIESRTYKYDTRTTRDRGWSRYEYTCCTVPGTPLFARRRHKTHFSQYSRAYAFDATGIGPLVCPATSKHSPTIKQLLERETQRSSKHACPQSSTRSYPGTKRYILRSSTRSSSPRQTMR